jgi:tetratricopeptide (TPR) repeat protein
MKDTVAGLAAMRKGRADEPNNINLAIVEANYFLRTNNSSKALNNLNIAIAARPDDANYYLVRGNIYDNLANPKDATGKDLDKPKDYANALNMAEADYKKAIELKPDNFDALYNLGVLYNNQGVVYNKQADDIMDKAQNAAVNAKATELFEKAIPVLENALQVNPTDRNTMIALKQIYARLQLSDKLKAINEKLSK